MLASIASGMATTPTLKNCQPLIFTFSRRNAISHRIVAMDMIQISP